MIFDFNGAHRNGKKVVRLALYAATAQHFFGAFWRPREAP
jgi:hypothetical protein